MDHKKKKKTKKEKVHYCISDNSEAIFESEVNSTYYIYLNLKINKSK